MTSLTSFCTLLRHWSKVICPLRAASRFFCHELLKLFWLIFSPGLMYGLKRTWTPAIWSSPSSTFLTCFWNGVSLGKYCIKDFRAGTPHPLFARSIAGSPPKKYSKNFHITSGFFVLACAEPPVAVMVGSVIFFPQVGAGSIANVSCGAFPSPTAPCATDPPYQNPNWTIASSPLANDSPDQLAGGLSGFHQTFSLAMLNQYCIASRASGVVSLSSVKSSEYRLVPAEFSCTSTVRSNHVSASPP